ncbi:MAG TPA: hypothetical protein VF797_15810 [Noviherbaspirillum sp.]
MSDTSSPEHRAACEARYVLDKPTLEARRDYLALVEKMRGKDGRKALEVSMTEEWNRRRKTVKSA